MVRAISHSASKMKSSGANEISSRRARARARHAGRRSNPTRSEPLPERGPVRLFAALQLSRATRGVRAVTTPGAAITGHADGFSAAGPIAVTTPASARPARARDRAAPCPGPGCAQERAQTPFAGQGRAPRGPVPGRMRPRPRRSAAGRLVFNATKKPRLVAGARLQQDRLSALYSFPCDGVTCSPVGTPTTTHPVLGDHAVFHSIFGVAGCPAPG